MRTRIFFLRQWQILAACTLEMQRALAHSAQQQSWLSWLSRLGMEVHLARLETESGGYASDVSG